MAKKLLYFALTFGLIVSSNNALSQIQFDSYTATPTGSSADVVAIGDLNNDGKNDVAIGNGFYFDDENDFRILVYLQNASGNLEAPIKYLYSQQHESITSIRIVDLNSDGRNDIAFGFNTKIGILFQNNLGGFEPQTTIETNTSVFCIDTGDMNNDGLTDIVQSTSYGTSIKIFLQNVPGQFTEMTYPKPNNVNYKQVVIGDLNADGKNDLAFAINFSAIRVYLQDNDGSFESYTDYTAPAIGNGSLWGIAIGDLNHDGFSDIAASVYGNIPYSKGAIWYQTPNSDQLGAPVTLPAYDCPEPIAIADLNNDGNNELILLHGGGMKVSCYEQNASNGFSNYTTFNISYATHYDVHGMAVGDLDNDGGNDIAIADYNNGLVILKNASTLGLGSFKNADEMVTAYPNPVSTNLIVAYSAITFGFAEIELIDGLGKILLKEKRESFQEKKTQIDCSNLRSGVYFLKLTFDGVITYKKIIKQ